MKTSKEMVQPCVKNNIKSEIWGMHTRFDRLVQGSSLVGI